MLTNSYPNYDPAKRDKFLHEFKDRGMVRWFGFYLSDHTAAIHRKKKEEDELFSQQHHEQMSLSEMTNTISQALIHQQKILIERDLTEVKSHEFVDAPPIIGHIEGWTEIGLVIDQREIPYDEIKYVEIYKSDF
jgi:hypothetical protein